MAELAKGRRRTKRPWLEQALTGLMRDHHRRLLTRPLAHIDVLDEQSDALRGEITRGLGEWEAATPAAPDPLERMAEVASPGAGEMPDPPLRFAQAIAVLDTMPGVDQRGAEPTHTLRPAPCFRMS